MHIPRVVAAALGQKTVEILRVGGYENQAGRFVDIRSALEASVLGTVEYPAERTLAIAQGLARCPA